MTTRNRVPALLLVCLAACSPPSDRERQYMRQREEERAQRESLKVAIVESAKDTDVIRLVKGSPSPDANLTTETWVDQQMAQIRGQVIFPRWEVSRRGSSKYEARYTYTLLDAENSMTRRGWRWEADVVLKVVGAPRELEPEESAPRIRTTEGQQKQRRIREEERMIE